MTWALFVIGAAATIVGGMISVTENPVGAHGKHPVGPMVVTGIGALIMVLAVVFHLASKVG